MSTSHCIYRHTIRNYSPSVIGYIWISDELLSRTLHQFTIARRHERYGSSVPGPLEARKRQAKRRMMNIAVTGGITSNDVGSLMGIGGTPRENSFRWQAPLAPGEQPSKGHTLDEHPQLPSWLAIPSSSLPTRPNAYPKETTTKLSVPKSTRKTGNRKSRLKEILLSCKSLDQLRVHALDESLDLASNRLSSEEAFAHFLNRRPPTRVLLSFLKDASLNCSLTNNLRALIKHLQSRGDRDRDELGLWIQNEISHGDLTEEELHSILMIIQPNKVEDIGLKNKYICRSIWEGIQSSSRHKFESLPSETLTLLMKALGSTVSVDRATEVIFTITLKPVRFSSNETTLSFLLAEKDMSATQDLTSANLELFSRMLPLLQNLPRFGSTECIVKFSLRLVEQCLSEKDRSWRHRVLEAWFRFLVKTNMFGPGRTDTKWKKLWMVVEEKLVLLNKNAIAAYLQSFINHQIPPFVLHRWVQLTGGESWVTTKELDEAQHTNLLEWQKDQLFQYYSEGYQKRRPLVDVVRSALASNPCKLRNILPKLFSALRHLDRFDDTLDIFKYLRDRRFDLDINIATNEVIEYTKLRPLYALKLVRALPELRPTECPGLLEALISDVEISPQAALFLFYRDSPNLERTTNKVRRTKPLPLTPDQVSLLHSMALAYASAPHLSPPAAFRKVVRCLRHFIGQPELMTASMSRAAVTAAITRWLQEGLWVRTLRLSFILSMVRELESEEVADDIDQLVYEWRGRIVRSREYRAKKAEQETLRWEQSLQDMPSPAGA